MILLIKQSTTKEIQDFWDEKDYTKIVKQTFKISCNDNDTIIIRSVF